VVNVSERTLDAFFIKFDANNNGEISFTEFDTVFKASTDKLIMMDAADPLFSFFEQVRIALKQQKTSLAKLFQPQSQYQA
jgi:hypothetical protein